jgi:hypothetical protein
MNRYCSHCSYNLKGSVDICPECGRKFDPGDAQTFDRSSSSVKKRLVAKFALALAILVIISFLPLLWAWYDWHKNAHFADMLVSDNPDSFAGAFYESSRDWPLDFLPSRFLFLRQRVFRVTFCGDLWTNSDLCALRGLKQLKTLDIRRTRMSDGRPFRHCCERQVSKAKTYWVPSSRC